MMWHITKREIYDNLNSLRFAFATVLLLALMLTNAVVHIREHPARMQTYRTAVSAALNTLRARTDLYTLAQQGPGNLYKKPSQLRFCAEGSGTFLPDVVDGGDYFQYSATLTGVWKLTYPAATPNLKNVRPDVTKVDWAFVIGYVLSLSALLFTFDSFSAEREQGTLRLMLANAIPRHTVLISKFLGAFISINIPFTLAVLINLLVISTSSDVHLEEGAWGRLGILCFIAMLYTCLFLALGLLVSARVQQSAISLMILLLAWVAFVVFMPHILASIASGFSTPMSADELWKRRAQLYDELGDEYNSRMWVREPYKRTLARSEFVTKHAQREEHLIEEHLTQQMAQVQRARATTRFSPASILQHLLEAFAGTGFERHMQFVANVQHYARQYHQFVVDTDRADPQSLHLIGIREGMSQKPVSPEAIPIFEDTLSLSRDFNTAATELLLLTLFVVVLLSGAYLAFIRAEV